MVHAVEDVHRGKGYSNVIYIGAAPHCAKNAAYLERQKAAFLKGASAPDFAPENYEVQLRGPGDARRPDGARQEADGNRGVVRLPHPSNTSRTMARQTDRRGNDAWSCVCDRRAAGYASLAWGDAGAARPPAGAVVRIAELEIDPAQLESYVAAVKEEMEAAVRLEPGVLAIYAVAEKDHPTRLRFFEIYASEGAYRSHIDSPHFK